MGSKICAFFNRQKNRAVYRLGMLGDAWNDAEDVSKKYGGSFFLRYRIFCDVLTSWLMHGAHPFEYFDYAFYAKSRLEKAQYITYRREKKIYKKPISAASMESLNRKADFNRTYSDFIKRDWISTYDSDEAQLRAFIERRKRIIAKPEYGVRGEGVRIVESPKQVEDLMELISGGAHFILEEIVENAGFLNRMNPSSLNTFRVVTVVGRDRRPEIVSIALKIGGKGSCVDNFHGGGMAYPVNVDTNIIDGAGFNGKRERSIFNKVTGELMLYYVGWDIAMTPGGFEVIEGNLSPGGDISQINGGLYRKIMRLLK